MSEPALRAVEKPARYAGGEWNAIRKDPSAVRIKVALAFPDVYEIGMSYLGQKILYDRANRRADVLAERVFAPWPDFEAALRRTGEPLRSLENGLPLDAFDAVAFSLLYELNDTNVPTILDLGRIPIAAAERTLAHPLIVAGGPAAFNPEPLACVFDAFFLGDGEEGLLEILDAWTEARRNSPDRAVAVASLARIPGLYVPSLYEAWSAPGSALLAVRPRPGSGAPSRVRKRVLAGFADTAFPEKIVVPNLQAVFDRVAVEVARGCPQKCRFCQATSLYHPHRTKRPENVVKSVLASLDATGYEDASLFGLSVGDYPCLEPVIETLMERLAPRRVSLSLSSLRPKRLSPEIVEAITKVRRTGFTLVPEAATERLRRVINKHLDDRDLWTAAESAFRNGWRLLKLYFMIGLPTETDEDVAAIPILVRELSARGRAILGGPPRIHVSLASFIPKPHTPFQWMAMDPPERLRDKQAAVRAALGRDRSIEIKTHDVRQSVLEAVFSRGDRRLHDVLLGAWSAGARFDGWSDQFRPEIWDEAFVKAGIDPGEYLRAIEPGAALPWDAVATGIKPEFLRGELERALRAETTPSCQDRDCGDCRGCETGIDRRAPGPERIDIGPEAPPALLGRPAADPIRYIVHYAKEGPARFLGHNDLVNALQRAFRRAGAETLHSEGFHPKPVMSFGPALPLGMGGQDEFMEFKSGREIAEDEFLTALNAVSPAGLRFTALRRRGPSERPFQERLRGMIYAVDLDDPAFAEAPEPVGAAEAVRAAAAADPAFDWLESVEADDNGRRLILRVAFRPQKIPRPQDLVKRALGLERPSFAMVREGYVVAAG
jgi:radical SAM family uncharacterized protein/radical SAM-linked protein